MLTAQQLYASRLEEIQDKLAAKQAKVQQYTTQFQTVLDTKLQQSTPSPETVALPESTTGSSSTAQNDNSLNSMMQSMMQMYSTSMMSGSLSALGGSSGSSSGGLGDSMSSMMSMMMMMQLMDKLGDTSATQSAQTTLTDRVDQYGLLIDALSEQYSLDANLVRGLVQAESGFSPDAVSASGAQGLMQLMPATAEALGVADPFDPVDNLSGGMKYLASHLETFNGDTKLALAAYNCGAARIQQLGIHSSEDTEAYQQLSSNVRDYVDTVLKYARSFGYAG